MGMFPIAENISHRSLSIPFSAALDERQAGRVIDAVLEAVGAR